MNRRRTFLRDARLILDVYFVRTAFFLAGKLFVPRVEQRLKSAAAAAEPGRGTGRERTIPPVVQRLPLQRLAGGQAVRRAGEAAAAAVRSGQPFRL